MVVVELRVQDDGFSAPVQDVGFRPCRFPCADIFYEIGGDVQCDGCSADGAASHADGGIGQRRESASVGEAGQVDMDVRVDGHVEFRPAAADLVDDDAAMDDVAVRAEDFLYDFEAFFFVLYLRLP